MNKDIRWKQRFENFEKAFKLLAEIKNYHINELKPLDQEGFIHRFEMTFELSWRVAKDYLDYSGHIIIQVSPRQVIKEAFAVGIIKNGKAFIEMIEARNLMSHTYDFERFTEILKKIKDNFLPAIQDFYDFLKEQL
jgi:nucleotidyltransferase substrate binding protein (TIGR01987 family)